MLAGARPERAPRQDSADDPAGPAQRHDHLRLAGAPSRCPTESPNLAWKATECGNDFGNLAAKMFLRKPARVTDRSHLSFSYGTQNDDTNYCQTGADLAAIQEEGSPAAPMLRAVSPTHHSLISC